MNTEELSVLRDEMPSAEANMFTIVGDGVFSLNSLPPALIKIDVATRVVTPAATSQVSDLGLISSIVDMVADQRRRNLPIENIPPNITKGCLTGKNAD